MALAADSESDQERPEKEPEFVIHIVDSESHSRTPLLPRHEPHGPAAQRPRPQPQALPVLDHAASHQEEFVIEYCCIVKAVHCILVQILIGIAWSLLPEEYIQSDKASAMSWCLVLVMVLNLSWLMLTKCRRYIRCR